MSPGQRLKLYCFSHAGAGVSGFGRWRTRVGPDVDIRPVPLPGRDHRRRERRITDRRMLLADLLRTLGPPPSGPYVLYGHSLGGLVAHTATRALEEAGMNPPVLVVVGASPPPDAAAELVRDAELSDEELLRHLRRLDAVPADARPEGVWRRAVLPVLRDDLRLARSLRDGADKPVAAPLLAVSGRGDPLATPRTMADWRHWTTGPFFERTLPGDHYFLRGRALPRLLRGACRVALRTAAHSPDAPSATSRRTTMEKDSR
ncbi:thioesterase II family protein [Streptomyces sp. TP-A0874]|uniref:thioesterase II family protein n=1 Tax=Streptomyces sp. TP-A0874 TaxID=549819 RepID=UPI0009A03908|nr:thioesterase domain-containing protein [Streptomyces sp. TP-A0874]